MRFRPNLRAGAVVVVLGGATILALFAGISPGAADRAGSRLATTPLTGAVSVSSGVYHACAVLSGGPIRCWGDSRSVPNGIAGARYSAGSIAVPISGIGDAASVSAGGFHTCAVLSGGAVECWGDNGSGQLGDGTLTNRSVPVAVEGISSAVSISAGGGDLSHTCAVLTSGAVECWGDNERGELGDGTTATSLVPVAVSGIANAVSVSSGLYHSCALLSSGTVECWGDNHYGQLGNGTNTASSTPVAVAGIANAVSISGGGLHTCALLTGGAIECWGSNYYGQLGDGTTTARSTPAAVSGIANAVSVSSGTFHTCAALSDGKVECWGYSLYGRLGNGQSGWTLISSTPVAANGIVNAVAASAGSDSSCAVLSDGTVKCWGGNLYDQLGNGKNLFSLVPVNVITS
jgi:alpha-tubulin suppressor-like RCC1 family protein